MTRQGNVRMPLRSCTVAAALVALLTLALATPAHAAGPKLVAPQDTYDFGHVTQGDAVPFTFTLRNDGDQELVITNVRPSCGCTAALASSDRVPPGGEATVTGEVKSATLQDRIAKTVTVESNDPTTPRLTLTVTGVVDVPFHVEPQYLHFGQVREGTGAEQTVTLTVNDPAKLPVTIEKIETNHPQLSAEVAPRAGEDPPRQFDITVRVSPDAPRGIIASPLVIHLAGEKNTLRVATYADIVGSVALYPQRVSLGLVEPGQTVMRRFVAMSPVDQAFSITDVTTDLPGSKVTWAPIQETPERVRITLTVDGSALKPGQIKGTLTVKTNAADSPVLTAELIGLVPEPPQAQAEPAATPGAS